LFDYGLFFLYNMGMVKQPKRILDYVSENAVQTAQIAETFACDLAGNELILLNGEVGVGKSVFAKGVASGLEIFIPITSPTFTFVNVYTTGRALLSHFDFYRLESPDEIQNLGLLDALEAPSIRLIEWGERISQYLPKQDYISVDIQRTGENRRKIKISFW